MKRIINIAFLFAFCLCAILWVNRDGQNWIFPFIPFIIRNELDDFIFCAISVYLLGIAFLVLWVVSMHLLKCGEINPRVPISWVIIYPLLFFMGIIMFQIDIWESKYNYIYLIFLSVVFMFVVNSSVVSSKSSKSKVYYYILAFLYLLMIVIVSLPNDNKKRCISTERQERHFKVIDADLDIRIYTFRDTVSVSMGSNLHAPDKVLQFYYIDNNAIYNKEFEKIILISIYENNILFRSDNVIINNYGPYKKVDLEEVLHSSSDYEFIISSSSISARQRIEGHWVNLEVR